MAFIDQIKSVWATVSSHPLTVSTFKGAVYGGKVGLGVGVASSIASYAPFADRASPVSDLVFKLPVLSKLAFTNNAGTLHTNVDLITQHGLAAYNNAHDNFLNPENLADEALANARIAAGNAARDPLMAQEYTQAYQELYGVKAQAQHIATATLLGGSLGAVGGFAKGVYDNYIAPKYFHTAPETQPELNPTPDYGDDL